MIVYLAGPMSGCEDFNFPMFHSAAAYLRRQGYTVISPAEADEEDGGTVGGVATRTWADYLRRDLILLTQVEAVATLPGWMTSRGARLEVHVARELGLPHLHLTTDDGFWDIVPMTDADPVTGTVPRTDVSVSELTRDPASAFTVHEP